MEVARIFTKHSICCDKVLVLTMSLYAFISLLCKQLLQYTLLKYFTVPSALLTNFPKKFHTKVLASAFIFTKLCTKALCFYAAMFHFRQTRYGGDHVVQFLCTSHPPYTPSIVDRSGTNTGLQSDPDETGLLQLGTLRRSSQQHPEVAACAEQCSQNRPPGTEAEPCQTADASTTLAAGSTQN